MFSKKRIISFLTITLCTILYSGSVTAQPQQAFERGIEELYSGNIARALDIWYNAYDQPGGVDSRIGFEYIRVVTERGMRNYYDSATTIYFRALTDGEGTNSRVALRQEIERMQPIIGDGIYRQWKQWWDERNNSLGPDMRGYWVQQDPTPAEPVNERLIEHWERIAFVKDRFRKNSNTVFGTDDRALIYIRYGEPDRKNNGILTLQSFNIKPWLRNQLNFEADLDERRSRNMEFTADEDRMMRLQNAIYEFHRYPEYEIWFYDNIIDNQNEPIIFLYGTDVRNDEFRLQTSLEDFIPERAYHPSREQADNSVEFTRAGISPALMLQLLYYEQLIQIDPFFETRLNDLRDRVLEQGFEAFRDMDLAFRSESRQMVNQRAIHAPREKSTYEDVLPKIPIQVHQYRFIDESQNPYLLTYVESFPQEAFLIDYHRNHGRNNNGEFRSGQNILQDFTFYELKHNLQTYGKTWEIIDSNQDEPPLYISRGVSEISSNSIFIIPHTNRLQQAASVVLKNHDPDSQTFDETPFSPATRGWNKLQYRQPPPLLNHPDSLEVADLVLGYPVEEQATEPFSFKVANDQIIPFGETLLLHFEVYNLKRMENDFTRFELTYRILPVDEDGNILTDQTEFILTLNFTNEDQRVVEDLEIETAELNPGLYELVVNIQDTESNQTRERNIRFEVME